MEDSLKGKYYQFLYTINKSMDEMVKNDGLLQTQKDQLMKRFEDVLLTDDEMENEAG